MKNLIETDVLIIGSGAAGIAAAVGAAEADAQVCLIEKSAFPGGRATASAVGTICGTYLRGPDQTFAMNGFPKEFSEKIIEQSHKKPVRYSENLWFLPCLPPEFESVAKEYLKHSGISVFYNSSVQKINFDESKIKDVTLINEKNSITVIPKTIIDASGKGVILDLIPHPSIPDENPQASALVFCVDHIETNDELSLNLLLLKQITKGIQEKIIPKEYELLSLVPASLSGKSILLKLGLTSNRHINSNEEKINADKIINELFLFLKTTISSFENAKIGWIAPEIGNRSSKRPQCRETLTEQQIVSCNKRADSICNGAWPIEFWEPGNKKVNMTYFPENDYYSIPAGCLISNKYNNLFFAGKLISSTEKANASSRVIGTCLGTGYSAGVLAGFKAKKQSEIDAIHFIKSNMLELT